MPFLSCILLSHLFLMSLQLSAIVILFSEPVPMLFDTELAVFFFFTLQCLQPHLFLPKHSLFPTMLFHCLPFSSPLLCWLPSFWAFQLPLFIFFLELFWLNPSMFLFFFSKDTSMFYIISGHRTHCYPFRKALNSYSSVHVGNGKLN